MPFSVLDLGEVYVTSETMLRGTGESYIWVPVHAMLITVDGKNFLYDAGCGEGDAPSGLPTRRNPVQSIEAQLFAHGLTTHDIDAVIISHLHEDHFGGAYRFAGIPVYVPAEELAKENGKLPKLDFRPVKCMEETELAEGLKILTLPGHTENLLGLSLAEDGKQYLFASDALYTPLHIWPVTRFSGYPWNDGIYAETVDRIRNMVANGYEIVWNHWPIEELKKYG